MYERTMQQHKEIKYDLKYCHGRKERKTQQTNTQKKNIQIEAKNENKQIVYELFDVSTAACHILYSSTYVMVNDE